MSEKALKTVQRHEHILGAVREFVSKNFPGISIEAADGPADSVLVTPPPPKKLSRSPDEVARELVEVLFPELGGDFTPAAMRRRTIATLAAQNWALKLVEEFRGSIESGAAERKKLSGLLDLAKDAMRSQQIQIQELQSDLKQAVELRGVHADRAKEELETKLANAERQHATDQSLLQTALRERDEARGELVVEKAKLAGLDHDHRLLMSAVSGNAEAPKKADEYLAAAVEKRHEFWGEHARRSPTAQLVLGDIIKARAALQPLTLVNGKTEQSKTA